MVPFRSSPAIAALPMTSAMTATTTAPNDPKT